MDADGTNVRALTAHLGWRVSSAAWSPDGGYIIFSAEIDFNSGNYELYLIPADGGDVLQLTDNGLTNWFPAWRPAPN